MADRMHSRLAKTALGTSVLLLIAAGCSDQEPGSPTAGSGATTQDTRTAEPTTKAPSSSPSNRYGAPPVSNPVVATRFLAQPCAALTPVQLQSLNLPANGKPDTDSAVAKNSGPSCSWRNSAEATVVAVSFLTGNKNGLADTYRAHEQGDFQGYWIETTVDSYPALFKNSTDNRKNGNCVMNVGISDTLAFLVDEQDRLGEKSCDRAKQLASLVIQTLQSGG